MKKYMVMVAIVFLMCVLSFGGRGRYDFSDPLNIDGTLTITGDIIPDANNTYDLGSSTREWKDLCVDGIAYLDTVYVEGGITTGGATPSGKIQNYISGNFVSDGVGSDAYKWYMDGTLTGAVGDTVRLTGMRLSNKITTQTATGNIGSICQLFLTEPDITDNLNGDITMAATIHIHDAPTEGVTNAALYVGTGNLILNGAGISDFRTGVTDGDYIQFLAIDDDGAAGATLEVARMFSANDPYLSMGGSQEFKFYNSGVADFGAIQSDIYTVAWTDYGATSTVVGWSGTPTKNIYYKKVGNLVFVNFYISGTSDDTMATFTLPYTSVNDTSARVYTSIRFKDNNVQSTVSGQMYLAPNSATAALYTDWAAEVWTPANTKEVMGQFWFEAQ